jgi:hypothetical protein
MAVVASSPLCAISRRFTRDNPVYHVWSGSFIHRSIPGYGSALLVSRRIPLIRGFARSESLLDDLIHAQD